MIQAEQYKLYVILYLQIFQSIIMESFVEVTMYIKK